MITDQQYLEWLEDQGALRTVLVEATADVDGVETTFYWATRAYTTEGTTNPVPYLGVLSVGVRFTERISLDNEASLSAGDLELHNLDGSLDEYLTYVWTNRRVRAWIGDMRWPRADFRLIFDGIAAGMDSKGPDKLNLKLRDKLQRLNTPVTETKMAAEGVDEDALVPLVFGEAHNMTPRVADPDTLMYRVHQGAVESVIEVRDNGKPVLFTANESGGTFVLEDDPEGTITCSVQGDALLEYTDRVGPLVKRLVTGFGKVSERFNSTSQLEPGLYPANTALMSFERNSLAWCTGPDGAPMQVAANLPRIEYDTDKLLEENQLTYSEQFDNAAWGKGNVTLTPNASIAPDGAMTADLFKPTAIASTYYYRSIGQPAGPKNYSVYLKSAGLSTVKVYFNHEAAGGSALMVEVNLLAGTAVTVSSGGTTFQGASWTLETLPDGWMRVALHATLANISANAAVALQWTPTNLTDGVYVWGAQLTEGLALLPYRPTTGAVAPKVYAVKGLLVEGAATKHIPYTDEMLSWAEYKNGTAAGTRAYVTDARMGRVCRITKTAGADTDRYGCTVSIVGAYGPQWTASAYFRRSISAARGRIYVDASRSGGGLMTTSVMTTGTSPTDWTRYSCSYDGAPLGQTLAGGGSFYIWVEGPVGSYVDVKLPDLEMGLTLTSPVATTGATPVNRAADVAIVHNDLDLDNFTAFDQTHPQPVGLPILERMNILEACRQLTSSVGAQMLMNAVGKLRLLQIALPPTGDTFHIYPEHMVGRKLRIAERPDVKAAVKLGFCRNHTVQKDLLTSIPANHKELFAQEWLTETKIDTAVRDKYRLHAEPVQRDTALLRRVDAAAEAQRELDLWKVQRHVYEFDAYASLLHLELGQAVTLHYPRFGLDDGKQGIVVMRAPDWDNARVKLGVLI